MWGSPGGPIYFSFSTNDLKNDSFIRLQSNRLIILLVGENLQKETGILFWEKLGDMSYLYAPVSPCWPWNREAKDQ